MLKDWTPTTESKKTSIVCVTVTCRAVPLPVTLQAVTAAEVSLSMHELGGVTPAPKPFFWTSISARVIAELLSIAVALAL